MRLTLLLAICLSPITILSGQSKPDATAPAAAHVPSSTPSYTSDGRLLPPADYRQWIYLTSGLDMSYSPRVAGMGDMSMFDNVFVNPAAWESFQKTGTWPDKTMLVLEVRGAESNTSINKGGHSQGTEVMGFEVHVKDAERGGWAFYGFDGSAPAKMIPKEASCYTCHQDHAAVDTTFVQFYPTLLALAKQKGTLSAAYVKDEAK
jgi:hypothetical protein